MPAARHRHHEPSSIESDPGGLSLTVQGQVQGVGFRPFLFRLAGHYELQGFVQNTPQGVHLELHGPVGRLQAFLRDLQESPPPAASITGLQSTWIPYDRQAGGFRILPSSDGAEHSVLISPDMAVCDNCRGDMDDPGNRRHLYPFTNCTDCGPRYTITRSIPYDRSRTSMACFPLCPECQEEYDHPLDRRFHAQPNACPQCGPHLWSADAAGRATATGLQALEKAASDLARGRILAVKGLGGFHLACNAMDAEAVKALRQRKNRPSKPLAVMVPDLETARRLAGLDSAAESWLLGPASPIVLAPKEPGSSLPGSVAPDTDCLGLMLPYTPLHICLFRLYGHHLDPGATPALIMTSGNASQEPIALGNREALRRLSTIADGFVLHDRDILIRCDDSVLSLLPTQKEPLLYRRARGFTPKPLPLPGSGPEVLGLGADSKASICVTKKELGFVSQHLGDLENLETYDFFLEMIDHFKAILGVEPSALVRDLHPEYMSSKYASEQSDIPVLTLQHHFAHIRAVLAENGWTEAALGVALDGTGLGEDGTLWGGELFYVEPRSNVHRRLGHFKPALLPGGEAAIVEPWRMAQSYLFALGLAPAEDTARPRTSVSNRAERLVAQMLEKQVNCLWTTSCGRLFDAVAALLGLCDRIEYEGQAAIRLEAAQDRSETAIYPCPVRSADGLFNLDTGRLFAAVHEDWQKGVPAGTISRRFHLGLCCGITEWVDHAAAEMNLRVAALSGGVMQNRTLAEELPGRLRSRGITPLVHTALPPNDACISFGQAVFARTALAAES